MILNSEQENLNFYIKQIIKKFPSFDLVYLIIKDIQKNYPNNLKNFYGEKTYFHSEEKTKIQNSNTISLESVLLDLLYVVMDEYDLLLVHIFFNNCN